MTEQDSPSIYSNSFKDFLDAYERGEADFAIVDGQNVRVVKTKGGRLSGLEDFASRLPVLSSAHITSNGTQIPRGFRYLSEGPDIRRGEFREHFQYNGIWFYFSNPNPSLVLRLGFPEGVSTAQFRISLERQFRIAYEKEPKKDPEKPIKFNHGNLIYPGDFKVSTRLADPDDPVVGEMRPYWRSYRNIMIKPVLRALQEVFPRGI